MLNCYYKKMKIPKTPDAEGKIIKGDPLKVILSMERSTKGITRGGNICKEAKDRYKVFYPLWIYNYMKKNDLLFNTPVKKMPITYKFGHSWCETWDLHRFMKHFRLVMEHYHATILIKENNKNV